MPRAYNKKRTILINYTSKKNRMKLYSSPVKYVLTCLDECKIFIRLGGVKKVQYSDFYYIGYILMVITVINPHLIR